MDTKNQHIQFVGKILAITKVKNDEGMAVKISLSDGTYIEKNCKKDSILFTKLSSMFDIDKEMKITVE